MIALPDLGAYVMSEELNPQAWPFVPAMGGADERLIRRLAVNLQDRQDLAPERKGAIARLLYVVTAAIMSEDAARRIFDMDWLMQEPGVKALIREWEDKGRGEGRREGRVLEVQTLLGRLVSARLGAIPDDLAARIATTPDLDLLEQWVVQVGSARDTKKILSVFNR